HRKGTTKVRVEYIGTASLAGSDDQKLLATLRVNRPAMLEEPGDSGQGRIEVAENAPAGHIRTGPQSTGEHPETASVQGNPAPAAYFKGKPVPLPPARPLSLSMNSNAKTKLALRRSSF